MAKVATPARWPARDLERGATLLEMLVVVAILGLISALVAASFRPPLRRASVAAAASEVTLSLALAQAAAMRTGRATLFEALADGRGYRAGGRVTALPPGVRISVMPSSFTFSPDGETDGAELVLSDGSRGRVVVVTRSGRISQERARHAP